MALKLNLKGSTLIETMTAMVIITMSLGIGTLTISGVLDSSDSHRETQARVLSTSNENASSIYKTQTIVSEYKEVSELMIQTRIIIDGSGKKLHAEKRLIRKTR